MILSRQSVEILLDLIEIKVGALQVQDRDDARELNKLRKCRQELLVAKGATHAKRTGKILVSPPFRERSLKKTSYSGY